MKGTSTEDDGESQADALNGTLARQHDAGASEHDFMYRQVETSLV